MTASEAPLSIVFSADRNFSVPLGLAVHSLLKHAAPGRRYDIHVLDGGVRDDVKDVIDTWKSSHDFTISYHDLRQQFRSCGSGSGDFTAAMYYRFLIPDLLPETVHRALYVDSDVMFLQDCGELFQTDLDDYCLGAVQDVYLASLGDSVRHSRIVEDLGFPIDHPYYLSGQLLMNLDRMRATQAAERLIRYAETHSHLYRFPDQDIMNIVLEGEIKTIPYQWCIMPCFEKESLAGTFHTRLKHIPYGADEILEATRRPALVHFAGGSKPDSTSPPPTQLEATFFRYRKETPWTQEPPYTPGYIKHAAQAASNDPERAKRTAAALMQCLRAVYPIPGAPKTFRILLNAYIRIAAKWRHMRRNKAA